jgi:hypothetical protein
MPHRIRALIAAIPAVAVFTTPATTAAAAAERKTIADAAALVVGTGDGVDILVPAASADGWRVLTSLRVEGRDAPAWTEYH